MNKSIAEKISEFRKLRSLSQQELGEKLGVTGQAVSKWEKGESMPDIMLLPELCQILGITADALLEVPSTVKKDSCMASLAEYAKEVGRLEATKQAVEACVRATDTRMVTGSATESSNGISVYADTDGGTVISVIYGEEMLSKLKSQAFADIKKVCDLLSDEDTLGIISALDFSKGISAEDIVKNTNIPLEKVENVLFKLMKGGFCDCDFDGKYEMGHSAYALMSMLAAIFFTTESGRKAVNSVTKNYLV